MTVAYDNMNGLTATADTAAPYGALSRSIPGTEMGDAIFIVMAQKPYSTQWTVDDVNYTLLANITDGTTASGVGTGSMRLMVWGQETPVDTLGACTLTPDGQYTISLRSSVKFTSAKGQHFSFEASQGSDGTISGTDFSATFDRTLDIVGGDHLMVAVCHPDDTATHTSPTLTIPGLTLGAMTARAVTAVSSTGDDGALHIYECHVTSGTASGAGSFTATTTSGDASGCAVLVRMREGLPIGQFGIPLN